MRSKLLLCFVFAVFSLNFAAAQIVVTGKVTDEKGNAVEGATIAEKGSAKNKTLTDATGSYKISVRPNAVIQVTSVAYEKAEAVAQPVTNFVLKTSSKELGEVVVTALGIKIGRAHV